MKDCGCSDEELVGMACGGDDTAFEALMRRHSGAIRSLIARFFRNRSMVDDLAQETFAKAYFKLSSFRRDSPFEYWLKRIAVRLCLDEIRARKTQPALADEEPAAGSDEQEKRLETRLLLSKLLASLSPVDRTIVVLLYGEGYGAEQVAEMTGISKANVKVRAFRVRHRLRKIYKGGL